MSPTVSAQNISICLSVFRSSLNFFLFQFGVFFYFSSGKSNVGSAEIVRTARRDVTVLKQNQFSDGVGQNLTTDVRKSMWCGFLAGCPEIRRIFCLELEQVFQIHDRRCTYTIFASSARKNCLWGYCVWIVRHFWNFRVPMAICGWDNDPHTNGIYPCSRQRQYCSVVI